MCRHTNVAFRFLLIVFSFTGCLNTVAQLICGYRSGPIRCSSMAEWHGAKNLLVSKDCTWGFMARFTPSAILQAGEGFVNPLLKETAIAFSSGSLCRARHRNSRWGNPESGAFDICITPGGNTFAQCTRQLILTMSSVLGERMKQRFDLIGYEKVSRLGPAGRKEGYRGNLFAHTRTNSKSFDLSVWLFFNPTWLRL